MLMALVYLVGSLLMVVLTPHQAAGLIGRITLALVLHLEGSQLVPGFQIATGLIDGLLMS